MRILVYSNGDIIGDGLRKLPFFHALRAAYPNAHISYVSARPTVYRSSLCSLIGNAIDDFKLSEKYDLVIDTQRNFFRSLWLWLRTRPAKFLTFAADGLLSSVKPMPEKPIHIVGQLFALLSLATGRPIYSFPIPLPNTYEAIAEELLPGSYNIALAPGAGGRNKCWPLERFIELGKRLAAKRALPVFLLGPAEAEWKEQIGAEIPEAVFPLQDARSPSSAPELTIALAKRCTLGVANDSGLGHMIALADIPLISLFGPTNPLKNSPAAKRMIIVRAQDFGGDSMDSIPLTAVIDAIYDMEHI